MERRQLGDSGLLLSTLSLGTRTWGLDTEVYQCAAMLQAFSAVGGAVIDIEADPRYPEPLKVVGDLLASDDFDRDSYTIILRTGNFSGFGPTRAQILDDLRQAINLLGAGHVDLLVAQGPRRDVELHEALSALSTAYTSGAARYLSLGEFSWWDGGAASATAPANGFRISGWAGELSLLRPGLAAAPGQQVADSKMGVIAGAPLSQGILTGKYRSTTPADSRASTPRFGPSIRARLNQRTAGVVESLLKAAGGLDRSPAQVALAWTVGVPNVATAVIGPRNETQLGHLLDVADWRLPRAIQEALLEVALRRD